MPIHPLAAVDSGATLGDDVHVGPFCIVESDVTLGDGCRLAAGAVVKSGTVMGPNNTIGEGAILGGEPQHLQCGERLGRLVIGSGNTFREHCTVHRGLEEGGATTIGDNNLLMINAHVAHDCHLGSHIILANNTMLAGHIEVDDRAFLSGAAGVHQFCRIGTLAMVGGQAHVVKDVPPYVTIDGVTTSVVGLNVVGLRRAGFKASDLAQLKAAYRLIYRSGLRWDEMLARLEQEFPSGPAADFLEFFRGGKRGFVQERRVPRQATIKLRPELRIAGSDPSPHKAAG